MDAYDEMRLRESRDDQADRLERTLVTLLEELASHSTVQVSVQLAAGRAQNVLRGVE